MLGTDPLLVRGALRDFRRTWPQLLLTDLMARALGVIVLTPIVGLLLKVFLVTADDGVLGDADIAVFLLHPIGLTGAVIVGAFSLGILFAEHGALMVIGFGAMENRRVSWLDALRYVARYGRHLVTLAGRFLLQVGLIATPFLAAIGGVYYWFLRQHDINFYLATRPPEFRNALVLAALLASALAIIVLRVVAGAIVAVPLVLFERGRGWEAMGASARMVTGRRWKTAAQIAAWVLGYALFSWVLSLVIGFFGSLLIPEAGGNAWHFALGLGATLLLMGLGQLAALILTTALFPLLVVRLYRKIGGTGRLAPAIGPAGTLGERASVTVPGKWLLTAGGAALLLVVGGGYAVSRNLDAEETATVIAHRGASSDAPENTMAAFELAIEQQADWIELDVQEDADGQVIVAHDSDFMKVAGNPLKVWDATASDLSELDIGSWFDPAFADQRVVTLREVLETARGQIGVVIELKYYGHDKRLEERVVGIVETARMQDDIMLMSLKLAGLQKAAALRPSWTRGLLNTVSVGDLTRLDLDFLALNTAAATPALIRRAHGRGLQVFVWTVNDPVQMSVMLSRGVDGLITDEPDLVRRVMEYRDTLGPFGRVLVWLAGETGLLRHTDEPSDQEDA
jgi:glycerophosphoryl diester phosphodiesterase